MATVRYFAADVDASIDFYTKRLGFVLRQQFGPNMAILDRLRQVEDPRHVVRQDVAV